MNCTLSFIWTNDLMFYYRDFFLQQYITYFIFWYITCVWTTMIYYLTHLSFMRMNIYIVLPYIINNKSELVLFLNSTSCNYLSTLESNSTIIIVSSEYDYSFIYFSIFYIFSVVSVAMLLVLQYFNIVGTSKFSKRVWISYYRDVIW